MVTKQEIAVILIRILAAFLLLQALSILPMSVIYGTADPVMFLVSHEFTTFIISMTLWFTARPLSRLMVRNISNNNGINSNPPNTQVEPIIFSAIGLIILSTAIPQLVSIITYNSSIDMIGNDPTLKAQALASSKAFTARYIAKLLVGFSLLFFSDKLCELIEKVRTKTKKNI